MKIEDHSIILAPGALHLALYEEIYQQKGDCLDINVMTPEAYISSILPVPKEQTLPTLYSFKDRLEKLSADNVFYESRADYEFLKACYDFLGWMQLYQMADLPEESQKDQDLKEVITLLQDIDLWQKEAAGLQFKEAERIYILDTQYPEQTGVLLLKMLEAGAHRLCQPAQNQKLEYWSASNPRKEMELVADEIIKNNIPAEDVFIALASSVDARVLDQVFNSRRIPHTFLHDPVPSRILRQFQVIFSYILEPSDQALQNVLRELYYRQSADLRTYLDLFPQGSALQEMVYEENPIISLKEFERLQSMEAQSVPWQPELTRIKGWDHTSMEDIATLIQELNPHPEEEDIKVFDSVLNAWSQAAPFIHSRKDLELFVRHLHNVHPAAALHTMQGALIGAPKEISSLRPVTFLIGADSSHFPGYVMHGGIFDENYLARTSFPPLQQRLDFQKQELYGRLAQPETLYVLTPQSNYEGDPLDASFEMNTWAKRLPAFQRISDPSVWSQPDFSLAQDLSMQVFAPHQVFQAGTRSLDTYESCPLKHMLSYGLHLYASHGFFDDLRVSTDMIRKLFFRAKLELNKNWNQLSRVDIDRLVADEMEFARKVFVHQQQTLDVLQQEYAARLENLIRVLSDIAKASGLDLSAVDYQMNIQEKVDNVDVEISGSLIPSWKAAFSLVDPANTADPEVLPKASLGLDFNLKPVEGYASKISYGRGSSAQVHPIASEETQLQYVKLFLTDTIAAQDLGDIKEGYADMIKKRPTYEKKQTDLKESASNFVNSLSLGCIAPEHKKDACLRCAYSSICRNGAREKGRA